MSDPSPLDDSNNTDADDAALRPSPGASGPGEPGYEGEATVGDEGAAAGPEAYQDPFGRRDS